MSPRRISDPLVRDAPIVRVGDAVGDALRRLIDCDLPALPVVDDEGSYAGIFGEREFIAALFPGYLGELKFAGFVTRTLEDALDKRASCRLEPVGQHLNTEHVEVGADFADAQVAEVFLHHRVLILPVVDDGNVLGVITRSDFVRALAGKVLTAES